MHQSQKDRPLPGTDEREFWQRAEDRNQATPRPTQPRPGGIRSHGNFPALEVRRTKEMWFRGKRKIWLKEAGRRSGSSLAVDLGA